MDNLTVIGAQWGDEGKGKIVDVLAQDFDIVVRFNGGNNAGHTIIVDDQKILLHLVPSGIINQNKVCIIGNGVLISIQALCDEMEYLKKHNINTNNLFIHENCTLILPYHITTDKARETQANLGTTKRGIGPACEDKVARRAIHLYDFKDKEILIKKLTNNILYYQLILKHIYDYEYSCDVNDLVNKLYQLYNNIKSHIINTDYIHTITKGKKLIFEGAQGIMLDIDIGTYPFVTSSACNAYAINSGCLGIVHKQQTHIMGITKAYTTRVGNGAFPTELYDEFGQLLSQYGNEFGTTTNRKRRCGWLDLVALKHVIKLNNINTLCLTKIDILDNFNTIKVCIAYQLNGKTIKHFPDANEIVNCIPVYKEFTGWKTTTAGVRKYDELPTLAKTFISTIETLLQIKIKLISTGAAKTDIIYL